VQRVEIHTDEANTISAAIPQRLGYRLDRIEDRVPAAPSETSRLQIWITDQEPDA
jgi:RimJ/RimL family protein N-acetyltransferase